MVDFGEEEKDEEDYGGEFQKEWGTGATSHYDYIRFLSWLFFSRDLDVLT